MTTVVVALREGFYGNTLRHPGRRFALTAADSARHRFVKDGAEAKQLGKRFQKTVHVGMAVLLDDSGQVAKVIDWLADPTAPAPAAPAPGSWHPNLRKSLELDTLSEIARGAKVTPEAEPPPPRPAGAGDDPPLEGDDAAPGAPAVEKQPPRPARPGGPPRT